MSKPRGLPRRGGSRTGAGKRTEAELQWPAPQASAREACLGCVVHIRVPPKILFEERGVPLIYFSKELENHWITALLG